MLIAGGGDESNETSGSEQRWGFYPPLDGGSKPASESALKVLSEEALLYSAL